MAYGRNVAQRHVASWPVSTVRRAASIRPVLGEKRTSRRHHRTVEDDPLRTSAPNICCCAKIREIAKIIPGATARRARTERWSSGSPRRASRCLATSKERQRSLRIRLSNSPPAAGTSNPISLPPGRSGTCGLPFAYGDFQSGQVDRAPTEWAATLRSGQLCF